MQGESQSEATWEGGAPDGMKKQGNGQHQRPWLRIGDHRHRATLAVAGDRNKRHVSHMRLSPEIVAANHSEEFDRTPQPGRSISVAGEHRFLGDHTGVYSWMTFDDVVGVPGCRFGE